MMRTRIHQIADVPAWRLCLGCGACAAVCPKGIVRLYDFPEEGIRPVMTEGDCGDCRACLDVCPGIRCNYSLSEDCRSTGSAAFAKEGARKKRSATENESRLDLWGPVLAMWEGCATDPRIRFEGASGGVLTALGAYCIERQDMHGVLHVLSDRQEPIRNRTRLSLSREELRQGAGSRYAPACVCNGLNLIEAAPAPCAVIGRPFEIAAVFNALDIRPELVPNMGLTMSFFCAESPTTAGTVALLKSLGMDPRSVASLRYRGFGWPGHFAVTRKDGSMDDRKLTYRESWSFLQGYRPWAAQMWPDGTGELADISCGDPWYSEPDGVNPGASLVVARTRRGVEFVEDAMRAGYLALTPAELWKLKDSQAGLLAKKASVWGRRLAMRGCGLPVTDLNGLQLRTAWSRLALRDQVKSVIGTMRRIVARKLYRPLNLEMDGALPVSPPTVSRN